MSEYRNRKIQTIKKQSKEKLLSRKYSKNEVKRIQPPTPPFSRQNPRENKKDPLPLNP